MKYNGQSLSQAWNGARLALASRLIMQHDSQLREIAQRCGYDDPYTFLAYLKSVLACHRVNSVSTYTKRINS